MTKIEPGRDPGMARRTERLNVVFALSSVALLLVLSWMIWQDYDREWKRYQIEFAQLDVQFTQKSIEDALGKVGADKRKALEQELTKGREEMRARRAEIAKAEAEVTQASADVYRVDQEYRFTKAEIDVRRYEYEEADHRKAASAAKKRARLTEFETRWEALRLDLEQAKSREADAKAKVAELEKGFLEADKKHKEALGEATRLEDRLRKIEPGLVFKLRNLPLLDMANPAIRVQQIMPANLYDDVIFSPTPKVDRCTTCHLAIDKKGFEDKKQPFRSHPDIDLYLRGPHAIEKVGCTVCHQGRGRATGFQKAAHTPGSVEQERAWGRYTHSHEYEALHYWDLPMLARGHTESQCVKCHQGVVEVPKAESLNAGIFLIERYGCFGCHKIKGWEGLRKVGPDLSKVAAKTSAAWIARWIREPKAFRPTRMPQIWGVRTEDQYKQIPDLAARDAAEMTAVVAYLMERSGRPAYADPPKGELAEGRKLVETVGCLACHRIGDDRHGIDVRQADAAVKKGIDAAAFRTHGPNLDGTGSKVSAGWLYAWLRNPKAYWHETKMPNLRLTEQEAADVTAYLMSLRNDAFAAVPLPQADPKTRDTMVSEYLQALLTMKQAGEKLKAMDDRQRTLFLGEKTIARVGCFGCHVIPGFETASPIGTELTEEGSKLVERLDFGFEHDLPHTLPAWLQRKLMEPRSYDRDKSKKPEELLKMPKFHFQPEEASAIVTAILSFTRERVPAVAQKQLGADERYVEQGWRLVRNFNCQGCHTIGAKGGTIRDVIQDQLETKQVEDPRSQSLALSPPRLYYEKTRIGEGSRVQTPWLHGFLKDPSNRIRPWIEIRMPTFDLTEEEANSVTRFFAAMDGVAYPFEPQPAAADETTVATGRKLFEQFRCVKCHVVAGKLPDQDVSNMAPDLALVGNRLRTEWIAKWLADPGKILPGTKMPANFPVNSAENAFPEILGGDQKKQIEAVRAYLLSLGAAGRKGSPGR